MPKKLRLDLKDLKVQSFVTSLEEKTRSRIIGGVQDSIREGCPDPPPGTSMCNTVCNTCFNTCGLSCGGTCASDCTCNTCDTCPWPCSYDCTPLC